MYTGSTETTPSAPASAKYRIFADSADNSRIKAIDANGVIHILTPSGLRDLNHIMNGGMMIQQRISTSTTAIAGVSTTTRAGVVADRWAVTVGNVTTPSWTQVDTSAAQETGLTSRYYGKISQATNAAKNIFSQFIINREMNHLLGRTVRLQVKIKQFVGSNQTYKLGLLQLTNAGTVDTSPQFISAIGADTVDPTWGANLVLIAPNASPTGDGGTVSGNWLSITSTANWARASATFNIPSNAKNLIPVLLKDAAGGATDAFGIAEFGMYLGTEIRDWVEEPFTTQLLKCQAYYSNTFPYGNAPVQSFGLSGAAKGSVVVASTSVLASFIIWRFPVPLWKSPVSTTTYNPSAANAAMRRYTNTATDQTATTVTNSSANSLEVTATGDASGVPGDKVAIHIAVDSETVN